MQLLRKLKVPSNPFCSNEEKKKSMFLGQLYYMQPACNDQPRLFKDLNSVSKPFLRVSSRIIQYYTWKTAFLKLKIKMFPCKFLPWFLPNLSQLLDSWWFILRCLFLEMFQIYNFKRMSHGGKHVSTTWIGF